MNLLARANLALARRLPVSRTSVTLNGSMATLTFDDFPRSAWTRGGPILARYGAQATYYVSGCYADRTADGLEYYARADLGEIAAAGHELACHTFSHMSATAAAPAVLDADIARNADFLAAATGAPPPPNFAYPFGDVSIPSKLRCGRRFRSARGIYPGINGRRMDLTELRACPIERRSFDAGVIERVVAQAAAAPAWLIFFSHDVSDDPSPYGCTPDMLTFVMDRLKAHSLPAVTVDEGLTRAGVPA